MSRYTLVGKKLHHTIILGWDNPLETYFAQVWDERSADDDPEVWAGTDVGEVETVESLTHILAPYAEIPEEIVLKLEKDRGERTPPTAWQRRMRELTK